MNASAPVPHFDCIVSVAIEQDFGMSSGRAVVVTFDELNHRDVVGQVDKAIVVLGHGRTGGARGITPTSSACTQAHGVAALRRAFM
jgi:hypothetical protein